MNAPAFGQVKLSTVGQAVDMPEVTLNGNEDRLLKSFQIPANTLEVDDALCFIVGKDDVDGSISYTNWSLRIGNNGDAGYLNNTALYQVGSQGVFLTHQIDCFVRSETEIVKFGSLANATDDTTSGLAQDTQVATVDLSQVIYIHIAGENTDVDPHPLAVRFVSALLYK